MEEQNGTHDMFGYPIPATGSEATKVDENSGRDKRGRFAEGNVGGPGRPRRAIEREYLATISDTCPPDVWQVIVARAVRSAKRGDAKSREWLAKFLLGTEPPALLDLAASDAAGDTADAEIARRADKVLLARCCDDPFARPVERKRSSRRKKR